MDVECLLCCRGNDKQVSPSMHCLYFWGHQHNLCISNEYSCLNSIISIKVKPNTKIQLEVHMSMYWSLGKTWLGLVYGV